MTEDEIEREAAAQQADLAFAAWPTMIGVLEMLCEWSTDYGVVTTPQAKPTGHLHTDIAELMRDMHRISGLVVDKLDAPPSRN